MSKIDKIIKKLLNPGAIMTFRELHFLLHKLGYEEKRTGKTSGSRIAYVHKVNKHIIRIHKPHPGNEVKKYVKRYIIIELKKQKLI